MKNRILKSLLVLSLLGGSVSSQAYPIYYPYVNYSRIGGYYSGWGYYPWSWVRFPLYGYSYWSVFNYAPYYASYGVISASPSTGRVGWSWGSPNLNYGISQANANCGQIDCSAVVWVQGGCAAVAKGINGGPLAWGYHASKYQAINNALAACQHSGNPSCRTEAWVCSY
ncbi:MAG: DUF4189 domain-containing protein [Deltaproteobacteria bacterium]|nr:DUF4189 domain-containing protein [Deltaproteobacteria bacterium]